MTYFKLDIPKTNESIEKYNNIKKECLEDIGIVYSGLGYTESAWNAPNAYTFIEKAKKDNYKIREYFNYLDRLYNEINHFKNNIDILCSRQGYRKNSIILKFDDSEIVSIKRNLNFSISTLNQTLNMIDLEMFDENFKYKDLVEKLKNEIKTIKNYILNITQNLDSFVDSINNEIEDSKFRIKRIDNYELNLKKTEYNWKISNLDMKVKNINKPTIEIPSSQGNVVNRILSKENEQTIKTTQYNSLLNKEKLNSTIPEEKFNLNRTILQKDQEKVENDILREYKQEENLNTTKVILHNNQENIVNDMYSKDFSLHNIENQKSKEVIINEMSNNYGPIDDNMFGKVEMQSRKNNIDTSISNTNLSEQKISNVEATNGSNQSTNSFVGTTNSNISLQGVEKITSMDMINNN